MVDRGALLRELLARRDDGSLKWLKVYLCKQYLFDLPPGRRVVLTNMGSKGSLAIELSLRELDSSGRVVGEPIDRFWISLLTGDDRQLLCMLWQWADSCHLEQTLVEASVAWPGLYSGVCATISDR